MNLRIDPALTSSPHSTSRTRRPPDRRARLVRALRSTVYFASLEAFDTAEVSPRCQLARLVKSCDAILRVLVNEGGAR